MHNFAELIYRSTTFSLRSLKEVETKTIKDLQTSGATSLVKTLQMIRLQKIVLAVGSFSIFEAILQDRLKCNNGFEEAKNILKQKGDTVLLAQFTDFELAINALKHGRGRSYDLIIAKQGGQLTSSVKQPDENFFNEGDVSEITNLIDVDDKFINSCLEIISNVTKSIKEVRPEVLF